LTVARSLMFGFVSLVVAGLYPQEALSKGFENRHFLEMGDTQKKFWLDGAITALSHVAASRDKKAGECVYNWYFGDKIADRNGLIIASMKKYPDIRPTAVLMALTERECGTYWK